MKYFLKILFRLFSFILILFTSLCIGLVFYMFTLLDELPTVEEIREIPLNIPLRIYSSDKKLIAEYGDERRIPVSLDQVPPLLIDAILVTEDDQFYHHTGVDFPGLLRAVLSNLASQSRSQGASTITMQVARNFFLNPEKTYTRKLKEILLAFNLERTLTKDEILELYLNKIFLGHRSYGFAAAAQVYYGVELSNLSVPEIAMLAGLPKAPSRDNPISNPDHALERRTYVLKRLYELGRIDEFSYENAKNSPVTARRHTAEIFLSAPYASEMARQMLYEKFGDRVYQSGLNVTLTVNSDYQAQAENTLRNGLLAYDMRHGFKGPVGKISVDSADEASSRKAIVETLKKFPDSKEIIPAAILQVNLESFRALTAQNELVDVALENMLWARKYISPDKRGSKPTSAREVTDSGDIVYLRKSQTESGEVWMLSQIPEVSGALVSLESSSGAILAITGGFDYFLSKFNRATQAKRQPGSNIKPFIYSAALENGFTPASLISATPVVIEDDLEGIWRPQNYSKKFFGPTRMREALSQSINLVSVRLLRAIGIETTIKHLTKFGFDAKYLPRSLSLALGSTQVTPLGLAASFAMLANGGSKVTPHLIQSISDADNNNIIVPGLNCLACNADSIVSSDLLESEKVAPALTIQNQPKVQTEPLPPVQEISPQNIFLMQNMLQQVIQTGTGRKALLLNRKDVAGKTGTTNNFNDAWFSGFIPEIHTTVYVGFDQPSYLGNRESGAKAALPIWIDYMQRVIRDYPEKPMVIPENITTRFINKKTALVTSPDDPDGFTEYFIVGSEPNNVLNVPEVAQPSQQGTNQNSVTESLF